MSHADQYRFTKGTDWFGGTAQPSWDVIIPRLQPQRILEIGCFEGRSTCYLIDKLGSENDVEIHCVDPWGSFDTTPAQELERQLYDMCEVEKTFDYNTGVAISHAKKKVTLTKHHAFSEMVLSKFLLESKRNYFDLIYIDGSHYAADVLLDALLGFKLLRIGGCMFFDGCDRRFGHLLRTGVHYIDVTPCGS